MKLNQAQTYLASALIVMMLLVVGYVLWAFTSVPDPVPGPGQSLQNPLGLQKPITRSGGTRP